MDSARLKFLTKETSTAKENAILHKAHKLGIVLDEKAFLRAIRTPGTLESFTAYDNFDAMQEFLDAKKVENKNIDEFFSKKCCGLNCIPIQLAALYKSVDCFAYIMQETPPQREIYENLMSCALVSGNTAICLLFKEKSENELKGLKIDNRCIELIPMPLLAWSNKVFKVDMSSVSVKAYEYNRPDIVLYCICQGG